MIDDHHGPNASRANLLVRAVDGILGTHRFSLAMRTARRAMLRIVGGRPGLRPPLVSYFLAASLRCQASSVAGVTGKT